MTYSSVVRSRVDVVILAVACFIDNMLRNTYIGFISFLRSSANCQQAERLPFFKRAFKVTAVFTLGDNGPLVVLASTARQGNLDFGATLLEIHLRRHNRIATLAHFAHQLGDFLFVQQKFARAAWFVSEGRGVVIVFGNVHLQQPQFAAALLDKTITQGGAVRAQGLDFRSHQYQAGLVAFAQVVIMPGTAVGGDLFVFRFFFGHSESIPFLSFAASWYGRRRGSFAVPGWR